MLLRGWLVRVAVRVDKILRQVGNQADTFVGGEAAGQCRYQFKGWGIIQDYMQG
jgi:hypothetical protein